jgi:hypothetical protein
VRLNYRSMVSDTTQAFVRNATNEQAVWFGYNNGGVTTSPGRQYGLQLRHPY